MKASELISLFERMYDEEWAYEYGAAQTGCVDCSGAFVWAYKQFGQTIAHGSNSIARDNIFEMRVIAQAKPGWAAFKRRLDDGEPAKYRGDGWGNFYHIGLVSRDGKHVLNAKGEKYGFCCDDIQNGWHYACPLKAVEYGEDVIDVGSDVYGQALVITKSGPLNVRESPKTGRVIGRLARGSMVDILTPDSEWPKIRQGDILGYASMEYLAMLKDDSDSANNSEIPNSSGLTPELREKLEQAYNMIGSILYVD